MKIKLTLILLLCVSACYAQTVIDKEDPFTHQKIKIAIVVFGKSIAPQPITLSLSEINGKKYISFVWNANSGNFGAFNNLKPETSSLMFKFSVDTVVIFKPNSGAANVLNAGSQSTFSIVSEISDHELACFVKYDITNFRIGVTESGTGVDMDGPYLFTDKNKKDFKKAASFILSINTKR